MIEIQSSHWQIARAIIGFSVGTVTLLVSLSLLLPSLGMIAWGKSHQESVGQLAIIIGIVQLTIALPGLIVGWRFVRRATTSLRQESRLRKC